MLKSFQTVTEAKDVISKVTKLCTKVGFNLTKFTIPDKDRRKNVTDEALTFGKLSEDKALRVTWNISKATHGFQTRHGLLSLLSSIYDPPGFGASFLLKRRLIIQ